METAGQGCSRDCEIAPAGLPANGEQGNGRGWARSCPECGIRRTRRHERLASGGVCGPGWGAVRALEQAGPVWCLQLQERCTAAGFGGGNGTALLGGTVCRRRIRRRSCAAGRSPGTASGGGGVAPAEWRVQRTPNGVLSLPGLLAGLVSARQSPGGALSGGIPPDVMRGGAGAGPPGGPGRSEIPAAACNGCRSAACLHAGAMAPAETVPAGTVPGITAPGMVPPSMVPPDIVPPIGGTILGGTVLGVTGCGAGYGRHGVWCRLWPARFRAADGRHGSGGPLSARPIGRAAGGMNRRSDRAGGRLSAGNCRRGRAAGAIAPAEGGGGRGRALSGPCKGRPGAPF